MKIASERITIGSRGSKLALWQAHWVKAELEKRFRHLTINVRVIKTTGDNILDSPLAAIGDKGLFTKEIEHELLEGEIDLAVHSLKDLPTELPHGLTIGAITEREDVHDVFVAHPKTHYSSLDDLPKQATIATGSLRRKCQLLHWRSDLRIIDLRGNLNTRFAKLDDSTWDGMILARAGVLRLGLEERITEVIPFERMMPAVGQGALAIELRSNNSRVVELVKSLENLPTTYSTLGERAFLRYLEGGCQVPIGTYGRIEREQFILEALIGSIDGKKIVRGKIQGDPHQCERLGEQLAKTLFQTGGKEILQGIRKPRKVPSPLV